MDVEASGLSGIWLRQEKRRERERNRMRTVEAEGKAGVRRRRWGRARQVWGTDGRLGARCAGTETTVT